MDEYTLIALCGNSLTGIHNIILSHFIKNKYTVSKIEILITKSLHGRFFNKITKEISNSLKEFKHNVEITSRIISGENLYDIKNDISNILQETNTPFILDITAGRKIMAVGAAFAFQNSKNNKKKILSYYLLKGSFTAYSKDRKIQNLLDDEWELTYYNI